MSQLDAQKTALILIDLQQGLLTLPMAPHAADTVLANSLRLVAAFQQAGGLVILVRVDFSPQYADRPGQDVDQPMNLPASGLPESWTAFPPQLAAVPGSLVITKRQWSAFYGTELDLQLRRRGVTRVVIGGIATNFGVESTARDAWQSDYAVVIAEDACSTFSAEMHQFAITLTLPRVSRIRRTDDIVAALVK